MITVSTRTALYTLAALLMLVGGVLLWRGGYLEQLQAAISDAAAPETSGLIFVESPEVYTRQRLVNDRYRQDAWLKTQLEALNEKDNTFIDTREALATYFDLRAAAGGAGADDGGANRAESLLPKDIPVPFEVEFELQSAVRDQIRQLILENALDDRHDLSGNTVFGLKFDTAVIPGSNTRLDPTVVVRMKDDVVQQLPAAAELSPAYLTVHTSAEWQIVPGQREALKKLTVHFDNWRLSVERRLNEVRSAAKSDLCMTGREEPQTTAVAQPPIRPLCESVASGTADARIDERLDPILFEGAPVKSALDFVMRLSDDSNTYGRRFVDKLISDATYFCTTPAEDQIPFVAEGDDEAQAALIAAIQRRQAEDTPTEWLSNVDIPGLTYSLPDPWGRLFAIDLALRPSGDDDACGAEVDISLLETQIDLIYAKETLAPEVIDAAFAEGWLPLYCPVQSECPQGAGTILALFNEASADLENAIVDALRPHTTERIAAALDDIVLPTEEVCFVQFSDGGGWILVDDPDDENTAALIEGAVEDRCFKGAIDQFNLGRYLFLSQIKNVESYTYAAFPRGDVQGVVTETTAGSSLGVRAGGAGVSGAFGLNRQARTGRVEARPSIINFAAGEGRTRPGGRSEDVSGSRTEADEVFDFGWSIVKQGRKEPMIASQLVLVSVPAYLDEVTLEVWKGFLDIDAAPIDRCAPLTDPVSETTGSSECLDGAGSFNSLLLEDRLDRLMPTLERREVTLNLPPDYNALDGVMVGANLVSGPRINEFEMADCVSIDPRGFTIAIPGERLWRSTVVTLDGLRANQIEVMPDMRGILARFDSRFQADQPGSVGEASIDKVPMYMPRTLTVWTSEGNDSVPVAVGNALKEATCYDLFPGRASTARR